MAQREKFTEDQLLDAVTRYAETFHGVIRVPALVMWASHNIEGMEDVKAHNFRGRRKVPDKRTGRSSSVYNAAYEKIQQINRSRKPVAAIRTNKIIHSSDPDAFFLDSRSEQRSQILDVRKRVEQLIQENVTLNSQNKLLKSGHHKLAQDTEELRERLAEIQERQNILDRKMSKALKLIDQAQRKEVLKEMGIEDTCFNLEAAAQGMQERINGAFSICDAIRSFWKDVHEVPGNSSPPKSAEENTDKNIVDSIIGGIDFEAHGQVYETGQGMESTE